MHNPEPDKATTPEPASANPPAEELRTEQPAAPLPTRRSRHSVAIPVVSVEAVGGFDVAEPASVAGAADNTAAPVAAAAATTEAEPAVADEPAPAAPVIDTEEVASALIGGGLSPATRVLITLAAASVVIAGFSLGREIIAPFVLAVIIVILVHPIRGLLERRGVPSGLASVAVILGAYAILAAMIVLLTLAVQQFIALITASSDEIVALYDNAAQWLTDLDLGFAATDLTGADGVLNPETLVSAGTSVLGSLSGIGTAFFFILAYVIFMAVDASRFDHIPADLAKAKATTIASFARYSHSVRVYFGVNTIFGLIVAVLDGVLLFVLDVPGAIVWTILAFVTNFIPNIGFVIGLIPAAIFALLFGGPVTALIVVAAYIVINVVMQTLVQPKFVSDAVHLSLTLTFASVIFWAFVLGPLGALLAVPLSLLMRELLIGTDKTAGFSRWITSDTSTKK